MELSDEAKRIFARLRAMSDAADASIKADPIPHLNKAADEICQLRRAIEEAMIMLTGADDLDLWTSEGRPDPQPPLREMCLARNTKAYERLRTALALIQTSD